MSRSFTKIVALAFAIAFTVGIARNSFAQDEDKDIIRPITKSGSAAMIFNLAGIGTFGFSGPNVGPFGSAIGGEYFLSDGMDLFVLLGFNTTSGDTSAPSTQSAKPSMTAFGIGAGVEDHFRPLYSTSPYIGGMVTFGSRSTDNGESGNAEVKTSSSAFQIAAIAGFDWFFTRGLCLGGQMQLGFQSTSASVTGEGTTTDSQSNSTIALFTSGGVHLKVYF